jgi:hypothetical protein
MIFLPLGLILLGLASLLAAAFMPVSRQKGWTRLFASMFVSAAFAVGSITQIQSMHRLWPGAFGMAVATYLAWIGLRKHKHDPEGRTPVASTL